MRAEAHAHVQAVQRSRRGDVYSVMEAASVGSALAGGSMRGRGRCTLSTKEESLGRDVVLLVFPWAWRACTTQSEV